MSFQLVHAYLHNLTLMHAHECMFMHMHTHTLLIDFYTYTVTTITGTGYQGNDKEGRAQRTDQEISSPWDIAVGTTSGM